MCHCHVFCVHLISGACSSPDNKREKTILIANNRRRRDGKPPFRKTIFRICNYFNWFGMNAAHPQFLEQLAKLSLFRPFFLCNTSAATRTAQHVRRATNNSCGCDFSAWIFTGWHLCSDALALVVNFSRSINRALPALLLQPNPVDFFFTQWLNWRGIYKFWHVPDP